MNCDLCSKRRACPFRVQVNLDNDSVLPIEELKGTVPVELLDLSRNNLGVASTIVIASLIGNNGGLTSLNLSSNQLCGLDILKRGTYTACLLYTSPSPRDRTRSRMPSSA